MLTLKNFLSAFASFLCLLSSVGAWDGVVDFRQESNFDKREKQVTWSEYKTEDQKPFAEVWFDHRREQYWNNFKWNFLFKRPLSRWIVDLQVAQNLYGNGFGARSPKLGMRIENQTNEFHAASGVYTLWDPWEIFRVSDDRTFNDVDAPKGVLVFVGGFALFFLRRFYIKSTTQ